MFRPRERQPIIIESERLGTIVVESDMVFSLVGGGNGSGTPRAFILVGLKRLSPFLFLVSVDAPNISCAILDPHTVVPDYRPTIPGDDLRTIGNPATDSMQIVTLVALDREKRSATLDLKHPILINVKGKVAKQVELRDGPESYEIHAALLRQ